ncbi:Venom carboxylesterase-6 [Eumeta japonica]|uniref:Carboxylic ester hydrolase n=1 Tax=Eumeta variegata TaxID=151549 RepID=A0A4C2A0W6_EUMVA|nr:Venom carboxylesterase-6 [Eumeta japonica]
MPKVHVEQGWLEGERAPLVTKDGFYYSFKGIPYAAPPIGKLRFKAPQSPILWKGIKKATEHGPVCPQLDLFTDQFLEGNEDCLYLNVYTPELTPKTPLPILVKEEVVLVTINYRVEVLGFLCLENKEVPGNAGMKDQVAALRWVQKNISNFGGDPNNVTIFGESAGGGSVGWHILSPMSKGLFQRAILMSGSPFCDWGNTYFSRRRAFALGRQLGITTNDDKELLEYLQSVPVEKLRNTNPKVMILETLVETFALKMFHFTPVVEKDMGLEHFLTDTPENYLKSGNLNEVDVMIGYTSEEALYIGSRIKSVFDHYQMYPEMLVPREILVKVPPSKSLEISDKIGAHYFESKPIGDDTMKEMIKYVSDSAFGYNIHRFLRLLPPFKKNRFLYQFSCVSERNVYGNQGRTNCPDLPGASHLDDLSYLFDPKRFNLQVDMDTKSYKMIKQTCALFANFAKCGNPTPRGSKLGVTWLQYDPNNRNYLDIGETLTPGRDLGEKMYQFWQSVYDEAN